MPCRLLPFTNVARPSYRPQNSAGPGTRSLHHSRVHDPAIHPQRDHDHRSEQALQRKGVPPRRQPRAGGHHHVVAEVGRRQVVRACLYAAHHALRHLGVKEEGFTRGLAWCCTRVIYPHRGANGKNDLGARAALCEDVMLATCWPHSGCLNSWDAHHSGKELGNVPALGCTRHHQLPGLPRGTPVAATQSSYLSLMSGTLSARHCCLHLHAQHAYGVRWSLWKIRT